MAALTQFCRLGERSVKALWPGPCAKPPPESQGWFLSSLAVVQRWVSPADLHQTLRLGGMEVRALTSLTGMAKYKTGVTSLRDKRNKSRQHLHPTTTYFSFRWSTRHLSIRCDWNGGFVQTSFSALKPHSGEKRVPRAAVLRRPPAGMPQPYNTEHHQRGEKLRRIPVLCSKQLRSILSQCLSSALISVVAEAGSWSRAVNQKPLKSWDKWRENEKFGWTSFLTSNFSAQLTQKLVLFIQKAVSCTEITSTSSCLLLLRKRQHLEQRAAGISHPFATHHA